MSNKHNQPEDLNATMAEAENSSEFVSEDDMLENCRQQLCPSCQISVEAEEVRLRALAEMENFKKRLQREKDEQVRYAAESVLSSLLPTLDNLDLALQYGSQVEACKDMLVGVEMTRKLFLDAIKLHGLEPAGTAGDAFDPEIHEAIGQEETSSLAEGHVVRVMQKGYTLKGRLLRSAKVIVSAKPSRHVSVQV